MLRLYGTHNLQSELTGETLVTGASFGPGALIEVDTTINAEAILRHLEAGTISHPVPLGIRAG